MAGRTRRPSRWIRRALRAPVGLYAIGAGRLLGHRFLMLVHRGRRSGRLHRTVLEVVSWDGGRGEAIVMSGFGDRSDWLLNVLAGGAEEIRIAGSRFRPEVRRLEAEQAVQVIADYERRNRLATPVIHAVLSRLVGFTYDGSPQARERVVRSLPLIAFRNPVKSLGWGCEL